MTRQTRLSVALGFLALSLVGCGMPNSGTAIRSTTGTAMSNVYSVGGQPQLIVKRRMGIQALSSVKNVRRVRSTQISGVEVDAVTDGNLEAALQALKNDPSVVYAEPNYRLSIPTLQDEVKAEAITPNPESNFKGEYGPKLIQSLEANAKTDGKGQIIAVVDTGVDLTHPELRDRLVPGKNFVTQVETEGDDGTTQLVDVKDNGPMDDNGHGTHVAGIIAAGENQQGMTGIAPRVRIMPVKTLSYNESGFSSDVANGVIWAADHGARVINMSLGAYGGSKALEKAVAYALSKGVAVVAAMGNDRDDPDRNYGQSPSYPAALPGVIAVGATDAADQSAYFSNAGRWISVSAPGDSIYSTTPTYVVPGGHVSQDYDYMSGTSMATPVVTGVIALMLSLTPNLSPAQVKTRLEQTADDVGVPGFDTATGRGRVNPFRALGGSL